MSSLETMEGKNFKIRAIELFYQYQLEQKILRLREIVNALRDGKILKKFDLEF